MKYKQCENEDKNSIRRRDLEGLKITLVVSFNVLNAKRRGVFELRESPSLGATTPYKLKWYIRTSGMCSWRGRSCLLIVIALWQMILSRPFKKQPTAERRLQKIKDYNPIYVNWYCIFVFNHWEFIALDDNVPQLACNRRRCRHAQTKFPIDVHRNSMMLEIGWMWYSAN